MGAETFTPAAAHRQEPALLALSSIGRVSSDDEAMTKYKAVRTVLNGITFDSKKEAARWADLLLLEKGGIIENLERQRTFELAPSVKFDRAKRATPALRYTADFTYLEWIGGKKVRIVEDAKGVLTPAFKIKRHLMKSTFGIDIWLS